MIFVFVNNFIFVWIIIISMYTKLFIFSQSTERRYTHLIAYFSILWFLCCLLVVYITIHIVQLEEHMCVVHGAFPTMIIIRSSGPCISHVWKRQYQNTISKISVWLSVSDWYQISFFIFLFCSLEFPSYNFLPLFFVENGSFCNVSGAKSCVDERSGI